MISKHQVASCQKSKHNTENRKPKTKQVRAPYGISWASGQRRNATLSRQEFYSYFYTTLGTLSSPAVSKAKALKYIAQNADEKLQKYFDRKTLKALKRPRRPESLKLKRFAHQSKSNGIGNTLSEELTVASLDPFLSYH